MAHRILCTKCGVRKTSYNFRSHATWSDGKRGNCDSCRSRIAAETRLRTHKKKCSVDGCENGQHSRGYCPMHYDRERRLGDVGIPGKINLPRGKHCSIGGCRKMVNAKGLCAAHYARLLKWGDPKGKYIRVTGPGTKCSVDGCSESIFSRDMCSVHWQKWIKYGDPLHVSARVESAKKRRLEGKLTPAGYRMIWVPGHCEANKSGWAWEHRKVMADHLGRKLRQGETVHHLNGKRADNRLRNLELWVNSHPYGQRVGDLVEFAREIIATYGAEADA